jgi:acyl-coenzyme A synthetase/AMP-(fatty) acid ligase
MRESRDLYYHDLVARERTPVAPEPMESGEELFLLYGSAGSPRPRGIVHGHGGYMVGLWRTITWVLDLKPTDVVWCTADPAWITGHGYAVYGPLLAGATTILVEGNPLGKHGERFFDVIDRHGATILYTTPTLLRMMRRQGISPGRDHDLSSLRLLATAGEPVLPEAWMWFHKTVGLGQCPLLDTWWQTETGMIMLSPLPISLLMPGSVGRPLPGIAADVVDASGQPVPPGKGGHLVIRRPWPECFWAWTGIPKATGTCTGKRFPGCSGPETWPAGTRTAISGSRAGPTTSCSLAGTASATPRSRGPWPPTRPGRGRGHRRARRPGRIRGQGIPGSLGRLGGTLRLRGGSGARRQGPFAPGTGTGGRVRFFAVRGSLPKTPSGKISRKSLRDEETSHPAAPDDMAAGGF